MDPLDKNAEPAYRQSVGNASNTLSTLASESIVSAFVMPTERLHEVIACAVHQQNKVYCEQTGDHTQVAWSDAPENIRASAIDGVKAALAGAGPEASHENWCRFKVADGWVYGATKSAELKTHPCLVPYGDLPEAQKRKDHIFIEMVGQLARVLGLEISSS